MKDEMSLAEFLVFLVVWVSLLFVGFKGLLWIADVPPKPPL